MGRESLREVLRGRTDSRSCILANAIGPVVCACTECHIAYLDRASAVEGLWVATGFSGHGFGIGPGAGRIMADLIQNQSVDFDLSRFRLARFSDGSPMVLGPSI